MSEISKHKTRMATIRKHQSKSHLQEVLAGNQNGQHLDGIIDRKFLKDTDINKVFVKKIDSLDLIASQEEVDTALLELGNQVNSDSILKPVFLGLLDGTMRAFKLGTKQGFTATRLYNECISFNYKTVQFNSQLDSFTESIIEKNNIAEFSKETKYVNGKLYRNQEESVVVRDGTKMKKFKDSKFQGSYTAEDDYNNKNKIYKNKTHAKSLDKKEQAAEVDHALSCADICNELKSNKALNTSDIKKIVNLDENFVVTSKKNNRGSLVGKFDKSAKDLKKELNQGYVINKKGVKTKLTAEDKETRMAMIDKMGKSQNTVDKKVNQKVASNILSDKKVQKRLSGDALNSSGHQVIGELVLHLIKPLYFELNDCFQEGIEEGVSATNFKQALKIRIKRMKQYLMANALTLLKGDTLSFFKNFISMLLEGILNCFVGIFKQVIRIMKEGFKILLQILPVLRDSETSLAQKGDAILKLIASSATIFAGIGIEAWLNSLSVPEPWSIILASILSAVLTTLTMYLLDKMDLFGVNEEFKRKRISELLDLQIEKNEIDLLAIFE